MNRAAIRQRLKEHMESSNGKGSWDKYSGSLLEADLVRFVEEELKQVNSFFCQHELVLDCKSQCHKCKLIDK
jgi:hypothetical protein